MSAGKLGRLLGLLFALAVIFGGVGAAASADGSAGHSDVGDSDAVLMTTLSWDWE